MKGIKQNGLYRTPGGAWIRIHKGKSRIWFHNIATDQHWSRPYNVKTFNYLLKCRYQGAIVKGRTPDRTQWELAA